MDDSCVFHRAAQIEIFPEEPTWPEGVGAYTRGGDTDYPDQLNDPFYTDLHIP